MGLYEHGGIEGHFEELAELLYAFLFRLASAIGEEDEGNAVGLEIGEGAVGTGKWFGGAEENTVNTANM